MNEKELKYKVDVPIRREFGRQLWDAIRYKVNRINRQVQDKVCEQTTGHRIRLQLIEDLKNKT